MIRKVLSATYQRLVEAALLLGHGTLAGKICQLCKALGVETRTRLMANTDPNIEEADSGATSPEHQALVENINLLRSTIAQDPQGIGDKMLAKNLLAKAQRSELRMNTTTSVDKARIIVDAIVDKTESDKKYFKVFVQILKSTGSWTKDLVNSLVRSLERCKSIKDEPEGVIPGRKVADKQYPESKPSTRSPGRSIMSYFGLLMLVFAILLACLGGYTFPSAQEQSPPSEEVNGAEVVPIVHPAQEQTTSVEEVNEDVPIVHPSTPPPSPAQVQSTSFEEVNEDVPIVHPSTPPPSPAQEPSPPSEEVNEDVPIVHPSTPPPPPAQEPSPPSEEVNEDVPIVHPSTPPPSPAQELSFPSEEVNEVVPIVHPESAPKMIQLLHFKLKTSATINIAKSIGTDYMIFGVCLLDDHNQVSNHEHGCHMKPVCTVVQTLGDWLNGKGKMPITWSTLVKCVEVSGLSALARDITGQYSTSIEKK